ncbi:hypothetical protein Dip518_001351 [Parelusimicrobium proximum]|uniref:hypothetical protein n=1 Tax=Parelusimicrobium proximum TaxID=3228953 RepID=UPI003D181F22
MRRKAYKRKKKKGGNNLKKVMISASIALAVIFLSLPIIDKNSGKQETLAEAYPIVDSENPLNKILDRVVHTLGSPGRSHSPMLAGAGPVARAAMTRAAEQEAEQEAAQSSAASGMSKRAAADVYDESVESHISNVYDEPTPNFEDPVIVNSDGSIVRVRQGAPNVRASGMHEASIRNNPLEAERKKREVLGTYAYAPDWAIKQQQAKQSAKNQAYYNENASQWRSVPGLLSGERKYQGSEFYGSGASGGFGSNLRLTDSYIPSANHGSAPSQSSSSVNLSSLSSNIKESISSTKSAFEASDPLNIQYASSPEGQQRQRGLFRKVIGEAGRMTNEEAKAAIDQKAKEEGYRMVYFNKTEDFTCNGCDPQSYIQDGKKKAQAQRDFIVNLIRNNPFPGEKEEDVNKRIAMMQNLSDHLVSQRIKTIFGDDIKYTFIFDADPKEELQYKNPGQKDACKKEKCYWVADSSTPGTLPMQISNDAGGSLLSTKTIPQIELEGLGRDGFILVTESTLDSVFDTINKDPVNSRSTYISTLSATAIKNMTDKKWGYSNNYSEIKKEDVSLKKENAPEKASDTVLRNLNEKVQLMATNIGKVLQKEVDKVAKKKAELEAEKARQSQTLSPLQPPQKSKESKDNDLDIAFYSNMQKNTLRPLDENAYIIPYAVDLMPNKEDLIKAGKAQQ